MSSQESVRNYTLGERGTKSPKGGCLNNRKKMWTNIKSLLNSLWRYGPFKHTELRALKY